MIIELFEGYYINIDNILFISGCTVTFVNNQTIKFAKVHLKLILDYIKGEK